MRTDKTEIAQRYIKLENGAHAASAVRAARKTSLFEVPLRDILTQMAIVTKDMPEVYWKIFASHCVCEFIGSRLVSWHLVPDDKKLQMWAAMRLHKINGIQQLGFQALEWNPPHKKNSVVDDSERRRINKRRKELGFSPIRPRPIGRRLDLLTNDRRSKLVLRECSQAIFNSFEADRDVVVRLIGEIESRAEAYSRWWIKQQEQ